MEINEKEARQVLHWIDIADGETGEDESLGPLATKIRAAFPNLDEEIVLRDLNDQLWAVEVEKDERVKAARRDLDVVGVRDFSSYDHTQYNAALHVMFRVKDVVMKELIEELHVYNVLRELKEAK